MKAVLILAVMLANLWSATVRGMTLESQVVLKTDRLNMDYRNRVEYLQEELTNYIDQYTDWGNGNYNDLVIPVSVQVVINSASPKGTKFAYTATLSVSDHADNQYNDNRWHFELEEFETLDHHSTFHMLSSLIDYYMDILISHQIDKLKEFGGDEWLERAMRIVQDSKFATDTYGWQEREELTLRLNNEDREPMRTLAWIYHTALYFDEVVKNDYEAWNAAALCVDLLDSMTESDQKQRFIDFSYFKLGNILLLGKDPVFVNRLQQMDNTTEHEDYYLRLLDKL